MTLRIKERIKSRASGVNKVNKKIKKAKDFPIGTHFIMERRVQYGMGQNSLEETPVTLVGYSRQGDEVVIVESDDNASVYLVNVNDLLPENYVNPIVPFMEHVMDAINNACSPEYQLNTTIQDSTLFVENESDGSLFELTVVCKKKPSEE